MLAAILYRLAGEPAVTGEYEAFTDVASDTWYTSAVAWVSANGIVSGVGDGQFAPMQAITREQLATMLYRHAQYSKPDTSAKGDPEQVHRRRPSFCLGLRRHGVGRG